ncbi:hypothetical protein [Spirosoma panaciterrae]|uniref:hypothetical protein n=1 Tax=Spirosoma panaciterrae TaxID=496058 RepID=UPI001B7FC42A|nr:hypothetical protein [Spirosoma panaciterrae]
MRSWIFQYETSFSKASEWIIDNKVDLVVFCVDSLLVRSHEVDEVVSAVEVCTSKAPVILIADVNTGKATNNELLTQIVQSARESGVAGVIDCKDSSLDLSALKDLVTSI